MVDQCVHCTARGQMDACLALDCSTHESWFSAEQSKRIAELEDRLSRAEEMIPLRVHRALALVETTLRGAKEAQAIRRQTCGNAPELVQGILDAVGQWIDRAERAERERDELRARVQLLEDGMRIAHVWPGSNGLLTARVPSSSDKASAEARMAELRFAAEGGDA